MLSYGPYRPDVSGPNTGFSPLVSNVLPQSAEGGGIGYGPFPAPAVPTGAAALLGAPRGGIYLVKNDGSKEVYYATATTIEQLQADFTWTSIDTGLAPPAGYDMSFLHYGSFLLNSNTVDGFQAYNVDTPAGNNAVSGAPAAEFLFSSGNVVFALNCAGNPKRMQSSGLGDHTEWKDKGANGITFVHGGRLVCGFDLSNGNAVVFQETAMRLIQFGNAPDGALYAIAQISEDRGSVGARSAVATDGRVFYLATDGFYRFTLSDGNVPIGAEKVDRWFEAHRGADLSLVQAFIDPVNKFVGWRYQSADASSTTVAEDVLCYHWVLNEWFPLSVQSAWISRLATPGYTLDSAFMDALGPLDSIDMLLDSRFFEGGLPVLSGLNGSYKFITFTGAPMAATLETCLVKSPTKNLITRATPIDDCTAGTLAVGTRQSLDGTTTWNTGAAKISSSDGRTSQRARGIALAFRRVIPAGSDWSYANGVDDFNPHKGGPK